MGTCTEYSLKLAQWQIHDTDFNYGNQDLCNGESSIVYVKLVQIGGMGVDLARLVQVWPHWYCQIVLS